MKNQFIKTIAALISIITMSFSASAQCVQCDENSNASGAHSSVIGMSSLATADGSFAGGYGSEANGALSFAFGNQVIAGATNSVAFGRFAESSASPSMVFGVGLSSTEKLINDIPYSLMVGFNSDRPTLFVGMSDGLGLTGKIGIGNVTDPQAKLHIKGDDTEDADLLLEPGINKYAKIKFGGTGTANRIEAKGTLDLNFHTASDFVFWDGNMGIGNYNPSEKLEVNGNIKQSLGFGLETDMVIASGENGLKLHDITGAGPIVTNGGKMGIGVLSPSYALDVDGTIATTSFRLNYAIGGSNPTGYDGYVLQSDANGLASWVDPMMLTVDDGDWTINQNNNDVYRMNGNVGVGTSTPQCRFQISDNKGNLDAEFFKVSNDNVLGGGTTLIGKDIGNGPVLVQQAGNMNFSNGGPRLAIKQKANNGAVGLDISTFTDQSGAIAWANIEAPNSSFYLISSNDLIFRTGAGQNQVYFTANGNVGIGVAVPQAPLDVAGKILCNEVEVVSVGKWKDYVFDNDYELPGLQDVEDYISTNGHLPQIPSETEVLENGYNLSEMDAMLLQKIEELTLYVIDLQKEIKQIKGE